MFTGVGGPYPAGQNRLVVLISEVSDHPLSYSYYPYPSPRLPIAKITGARRGGAKYDNRKSLTSSIPLTGIRQPGGGDMPLTLCRFCLSIDGLTLSIDLPESILGAGVSHGDIAAFFEPVWDQS